MSSQQSTYPEQHEPWRPDYPPVWNYLVVRNKHLVALDFPKRPSDARAVLASLLAFNTTRAIIDKAMKQ